MDRIVLTVEIIERGLCELEGFNTRNRQRVKNAQDTIHAALELMFKRGIYPPEIPKTYRFLRRTEREKGEKTMFKRTDFSGCNDDFRQKNIEFFEILEAEKAVTYVVRTYNGTNYYDLLEVSDSNAIPVPVFLRIIGRDENLVAGKVITILREKGIKVTIRKEKIQISYWGGEHVDTFFIRSAKFHVWFHLGSGLHTGGNYDMGNFDMSPSFNGEKEPDGSFLDSVELLNFVYEHTGLESIEKLLSDEKIGWIWIDIFRHLQVKDHYGVPLTEEEEIWFGIGNHKVWEEHKDYVKSSWGDWRVRVSSRYEGDPICRRAIDWELLEILSKEAEQLDEATLETGEKVAALCVELPWHYVDVFDDTIVRRGNLGPFQVIPWGKIREGKLGEPGVTCNGQWIECGEDRGVNVPETSNPIPFLTDKKGNRYYLARNTGLPYQRTRIERDGKLVAYEKTYKYVGKSSFVFVIGNDIPEYKKRDDGAVVEIRLKGYDEHRRYPGDKIDTPLCFHGPPSPLMYMFHSDRKHHLLDKDLLWNNPSFTKMCLLYTKLRWDRNQALEMFEKFTDLTESQEHEALEKTREIYVFFEELFKDSSGGTIQLTPNLVITGYVSFIDSDSGIYVTVKFGDLITKTIQAEWYYTPGPNREEEEALQRIALTLAYFGEELPDLETARKILDSN